VLTEEGAASVVVDDAETEAEALEVGAGAVEVASSVVEVAGGMLEDAVALEVAGAVVEAGAEEPARSSGRSRVTP
jgi:hypothetical protein